MVMETKQIPKLFVATKAFISNKGKVLVLRESKKYVEGTNAGLFDVVGGRMTPGERFDTCLIREVKEETGLDVTIGHPFFVGEWRPVVAGEHWQIVGIFFECFAHSENVTLSSDHTDSKWIDPKNYKGEGLIPNLSTAFEAYLSK
jgi:8-oxo-dGTP diphosphatase